MLMGVSCECVLLRNNQTAIAKYAIFGAFDGPAAAGNMITGGKLNEVGIAYRDAK